MGLIYHLVRGAAGVVQRLAVVEQQSDTTVVDQPAGWDVTGSASPVTSRRQST